MQAGGTQQANIEPSLAKRMLSAFAARSGVYAALLAQRGITAPAPGDLLDADEYFAETIVTTADAIDQLVAGEIDRVRQGLAILEAQPRYQQDPGSLSKLYVTGASTSTDTAAAVRTVELEIEGMTCAACATRVENGRVIRGASRMRLTLMSKANSTSAKPAVPEIGAAER